VDRKTLFWSFGVVYERTNERTNGFTGLVQRIFIFDKNQYKHLNTPDLLYGSAYIYELQSF